MTYQVAGRRFDNYGEALRYAQQRAAETGQAQTVMEKLDARTPWHVLQTVGER